MAANLVVIAVEVAILGGVTLALHRMSIRFGLIPLAVFVAAMAVLVQFAAAPGGGPETATIILTSIILLSILILYVVDGTLPARTVIISLLGISSLCLLLFLIAKLSPWIIEGKNSAIPPNIIDPWTGFLSILALLAELLILIVAYQSLRNFILDLPIWFVSGAALLVSLGADILFRQVLVPGTFSNPNSLLERIMAGLILWPLAGWYLSRVAAPESKFHRSSEDKRPVLDLIFLPLSNLESALARSEASLKESHALYRSLVEVLPMSVCRKDIDGHFTFANQRYAEEFKLTPEDIIGKTDFDLHPTELAEMYREDDRTIMAGGKTIEMIEVHQPIGGKTIYVQVFKSPIYNSQGQVNGVQIIFWDVSEHKQAEDQVRRLNETLEQRVAERTSQLEAVNHELESLSYAIGHDLRSPIRAIVAYSHMLLDEPPGKIDLFQEQKLRQINQVAARMGHMVDEFLTFLRLGRNVVHRQTVDLKPFVEHITHELEPTFANRKVVFSIQSMPSCQADANLLKDVYLRLLSNALKFTSACELARIEIGAVEQNGETCYFVRDNGVGFNMKYATKLFGIFQRLHREDEFEGAGIGLATVQRIIQLHDGKIWAESEVGKGATFYFTLTHV